LGLFDRPADEKAIGALLKPPAIPGLTETLADLSPIERRTILARLRRAKLLAGEDPHNPGHLDTHPLVREYFGERLRSHRTEACKECNRRLYEYYRALAPQLPDNFREMEPLLLAAIYGCNAGLYREALHEVYLPRIQRGNASFAANVLGVRGTLLLVLSRFFEDGRWGSFAETIVEGQSLSAEDQLFVLMQAGQYLTNTRGSSSPEARICNERLESLCNALDRPMLLYIALKGHWRYSLVTDKVSATTQIAQRIRSLAQEHDDSALMLLEWHFGEIPSCQATMAESISLATFLLTHPAQLPRFRSKARLRDAARNLGLKLPQFFRRHRLVFAAELVRSSSLFVRPIHY
jgi:hypothetical protein